MCEGLIECREVICCIFCTKREVFICAKSLDFFENLRIIKTYQEERMNEMNYENYTKGIADKLIKEIEDEKKFTFRKLLRLLELNALLSR